MCVCVFKTYHAHLRCILQLTITMSKTVAFYRPVCSETIMYVLWMTLYLLKWHKICYSVLFNHIQYKHILYQISHHPNVYVGTRDLILQPKKFWILFSWLCPPSSTFFLSPLARLLRKQKGGSAIIGRTASSFTVQDHWTIIDRGRWPVS